MMAAHSPSATESSTSFYSSLTLSRVTGAPRLHPNMPLPLHQGPKLPAKPWLDVRQVSVLVQKLPAPASSLTRSQLHTQPPVK